MLPHLYISGVISQFTVHPFGLLLAPWVFRVALTATAVPGSVHTQSIFNPPENDEPDRAQGLKGNYNNLTPAQTMHFRS